MSSLTCLSPDPHEDNIKDPILHYLGCIDILNRNEFLKSPSNVQSPEETAPEGTAPETTAVQPDGNEQNRDINEQEKAAWREDCLSELRRIAFLRSKLQEDEKEKHLVERIDSNEEDREQQGSISNDAYEPGRDVNTPFMLFKKQNSSSSTYEPDNDTKDTNYVRGKKPLGDRDDNEKIRYFHIPSNNMLWAEQAVSRYYDEDRPNFHPTQGEIQARKKSKAAWILKESHWRGQLHGRRSTVSSRYMRPFCESIRSLDDATQSPVADIVAHNIVLFISPEQVDSSCALTLIHHHNQMPYMHWETSRNQQRFSQIIENIVDTKSRKDKQRQEQAREDRQAQRQILTRPKRPTPSDSRSCWDRIRERFRDSKEASAENPNAEAALITYGNKTPQSQFGPLRSMTGVLKAEEVRKRLNLSGRFPRVDKHGRLDLDAWLKEQRRAQQRPRFNQTKKDTEPRPKLGQYLRDSARLFEGMTSYRDRKLLETYLMQDPPMHPRHTLDQAYYWFLNNQIIEIATRWSIGLQQQILSSSIGGMWTAQFGLAMTTKTTSNWMISTMSPVQTKLSSRAFLNGTLGANKHDTSGIHKSIRMRINEGGICVRSVFELALVIFEECSNTFFDRTRTMDKQPQVLDEFSEAIGNIMHQQTDAFERLWRWTERASKMYRKLPGGGVLSELHIPLLDINPEEADRAAYQWFCNNASELLKRVGQRISQLEELERSAKSTAEMVKDLLELKQQQAGVVQAWQSVKYSNEAMRQGRSILVFTIVTIVFLPLSFMSRIFGMNAIDFGGSDNVMHLRDQFTYMFSISAGVIVLTLLFSISTSVRTFPWFIFTQSITRVLVWTRLYRYIYLRMNSTTDGLYENAMKMTENLKSKEKEKFLTFRRTRREEKDKTEQTPADPHEDGSTKEGGVRGPWARYRKKVANGSPC
ncbi:hypothetical protein LA080_000847 [Diaporthe eres]|nr:hypothetical protein LA080_000847 [Diaporthe eres]